MTFKRPTSVGWAVLALGALCAVGFVDAALAQTAAPPQRRRLTQPRPRHLPPPFPTRATPPGCSYPARSF